MNAIKLLEQQHREVEELFAQFEDASDSEIESKQQLVKKIMDALAAHAAIEERIFYPATKDARTEELLHEAVEEHLGAKRIIADLLDQGLDDAVFKAKVKVLQEQIEHHVAEEEKELFPKVKKLLGGEELDELGERMQEMHAELIGEKPRMQIPGETDEAAHI
jgi:hemerythrin superfamily protein